MGQPLKTALPGERRYPGYDEDLVARRHAATQTGLALATFPEHLPYALEALLSGDFPFADGRGGADR